MAGQTALYAACKSASLKIVESLLNYKVRAKKASSPNAGGRKGGTSSSGRREGSRDDQGQVVLRPPPPTQQTTPKKTGHIQSLLAKLRGQSLQVTSSQKICFVIGNFILNHLFIFELSTSHFLHEVSQYSRNYSLFYLCLH